MTWTCNGFHCLLHSEYPGVHDHEFRWTWTNEDGNRETAGRTFRQIEKWVELPYDFTNAKKTVYAFEVIAGGHHTQFTADFTP